MFSFTRPVTGYGLHAMPRGSTLRQSATWVSLCNLIQLKHRGLSLSSTILTSDRKTIFKGRGITELHSFQVSNIILSVVKGSITAYMHRTL